MSSKAHAERLSRAIEMSGLAQPVSAVHAPNRVNVLCRVSQGNEARWAELIRKILLATEAEAEEAHAWQAHICRHYFLKEIEGEKKLVFGWNISIQSQEMSTSLDFLMRVLKGEPPRIRSASAQESDEMAITGLTEERNVPRRPGQRGAFTIGGKSDFKISGAGR
jgi:predicted transcriptional regulator